MGVVGPVPEAWQVTVGTRLAGVLGGGLAVHLQDPAAGLAEHAAHDVDVVDLDGCCGGLVGLVEALQHRRHQTFGGADQSGGLTQVLGGHAAHLGGPLDGVAHEHLLQLGETDRMRIEVGVVDPVVVEELVEEGVHQHHVGARPGSEVDCGRVRDGRLSGVDARSPSAASGRRDGPGSGSTARSGSRPCCARRGRSRRRGRCRCRSPAGRRRRRTP